MDRKADLDFIGKLRDFQFKRDDTTGNLYAIEYRADSILAGRDVKELIELIDKHKYAIFRKVLYELQCHGFFMMLNLEIKDLKLVSVCLLQDMSIGIRIDVKKFTASNEPTAEIKMF